MRKIKKFFEWLYYEHSWIIDLMIVIPELLALIAIAWFIDTLIVKWWIGG